MSRWFVADHRTVGTWYLLFAGVMLFVGGAWAFGIRAELFEPGLQFLEPAAYYRALSAHGLFTVFGALLPAFAGLASRMVPPMLGQRDLIAPRLNAWSFWLLPVAFVLLGAALFSDGSAGIVGPPAAPLGGMLGEGIAPFAVAMLLIAISLSLCGANVLATVWAVRAQGRSVGQAPTFVLVMALAAVTWVILGTSLAFWAMSLLDARFGPGAAGEGVAVAMTYRYDFWFYDHPEIYLVILPAFGIVTEVIGRYAGRRPYGSDALLPALASIAVLGLLAWFGRMSLDRPLGAALFFLYASLLVAVPSAVVLGNWVATFWRRPLAFEAPLCFALAAVAFLALATLSGLMLSSASFAAGSTLTVAHAHVLYVAGAQFGIFAGVYHWWPFWTGRMYDETLAKVHFWLSVVGLNATFLPQYLAGASGMLRRIPDYPLPFAPLNAVATAGGFLLGFAQLVFVLVLIRAWRSGPPAPAGVRQGWDAPVVADTRPAGKEAPDG